MEKVPTRDMEISQQGKLRIIKKTCARISIPRKPPIKMKYSPYISAEAKALFSKYIKRKQVVKERDLA